MALDVWGRSGLVVRRKYDQTAPGRTMSEPHAGQETSYSTVATRSDPHHFPNHMDVQDADHYQDPRRRRGVDLDLSAQLFGLTLDSAATQSLQCEAP